MSDSSSSSRRRRLKLLGAVGLVAFLLVWEFVVSAGIVDRKLIGSPIGAVSTGIALFKDQSIWRDIGATIYTLSCGLLLSLVIGAPLSLILGRWTVGWNAAELPILLLNATPTVALTIPIIMLLGIGPASKVMLAFIGAVIPILVAGRAGAAAVPEAYMRAARVFGAGKLDIFLKVTVPYSLLAVLSGMRLAVGRALTAVLVGEMYATQHGLGLWVSKGQNGLDGDLLAFITLFVAATGSCLIGLVNMLDKHFSKWRAE
jgi:NitT/TauT family transport system permease protein